MKLTLVILSLEITVAFLIPKPTKLRPKYLQVQTKEGEEWLDFVSRTLKLTIDDMDGGFYSMDSNNEDYGIEVVRTEIKSSPFLGIELSEVKHSKIDSGRGLVLISGLTGNALADGKLQVGDTIVGVQSGDVSYRTTALDYEQTIAAITSVEKQNDSVTIQINRLVERAPIDIKFKIHGTNDQQDSAFIRARAGENLRSVLMRANAKLYDPKTKRLDQPFATGDCGGEGICGTCLVKILQGADSLSSPDKVEYTMLRGKPDSWRAACRVAVGADNQPAALSIELTPQVAASSSSGLPSAASATAR